MTKWSTWKTTAVLGALLMIPAFGWAHSSSITIAAPSNGQEFVTDTLPLTVNVEGTISHSNPSNVSGMPACVSLDGNAPECVAAPDGLGNAPSYNYTVPVSIGTAGPHTLQASTHKDGAHTSSSAVINITVVLTSTTCDEVDPPAYANHYLNSLDLPQAFAQYRGKVIRQIANNHADGEYGSCTYDYDLVMDDVDDLLYDLGFYNE